MTNKKPYTYQQAGVDIAAGNALVERIKPFIKQTHRPGAMGSLGGFGGLFDLSEVNCDNPVLVSGTDGVGTKLKLAQQLNDHSTIGIDLVAMCVNDIIVMGAEPLFFLDYYACGQLNTDQAAEVISGIAEGCRLSGCALIGGETAEMPGMYSQGDYDLAGFVVGVVDKTKIIDGSHIKAGHQIVGVASSGPHSNGYSLIRRLIDDHQLDLSQAFDGSILGRKLLQPTTLYPKPVLSLLNNSAPVLGMAHITGGGLMENISRVIPKGLAVEIKRGSWTMPEVFSYLQDLGQIEETELFKTFNSGIGLCLIVPDDAVSDTINHFKSHQLAAWSIGQVTKHTGQDVTII
ncbi:phosphoribosylformylglycinamidine cyclo-ligase [Marinicella gelatinilytica]|uniref:phosphoribosylformylglycinamidine cyclo-ligase n=1 Tax=Marinicella gelatinilytica TaxID=2996017 RepID=UPI002260EEE5|nr:phosphoribosylformylglycinamidine cyclo-ligase [Marinicella gelatinilytica]MCX7546273.1 phosphoribosylformylglycinamidine cyclo-ligase [Marinicella gelatinilytica]